MHPFRGSSLVFIAIFPIIQAQILGSKLNNLRTSVLGDPTVIADLAPVETDPALLSTVEAYFTGLLDVEADAVPTAPPTFMTALPSAAQDDMIQVFAEENSIIAANGGLGANGPSALSAGSAPPIIRSSANLTVTAISHSQNTPSGFATLTTTPSTGTESVISPSTTSSSSGAVEKAVASRVTGLSCLGIIVDILVELCGLF